MSRVLITIPIKTVSEGNCNEYFLKKSERHRRQKFFTKLAFNRYSKSVRLPCMIKLTRIAPRSLDKHDNLPMSMKWVLDAICECLIPGLKPGRADEDKRIHVEYFQERGDVRQYAIRIEILF